MFEESSFGWKHITVIKKIVILFLEIVWLSTSIKSIKRGFHKLYSNKIVQLPNNAIVQINYFYWY
jgi:hypothetical protein